VIYLEHADRPESGFTRTELLVDEEFVTYGAIPLIAREEIIGVLEIFNRTVFVPDSEWLEFLEALAGQTAIALNNAQLIEELRYANVNLSQAYDRTLEGWSNALELRDDETEGHAQRVADMALCLAAYMGLPDVDLRQIRRGALLHDIGKIGIPDHVLLNPGPLNDEQWKIMRMHPQFAYDLLAPIEFLRPALDIPYCHHERWDGSGYPHGLSGEQIPLSARIFAVVDVWDALLSNRPYRRAWPEEKVLAHLRHQAGKGFDPQVVEAFLEMISADTGEMVNLRAEKIKHKIGTGQLVEKPEFLPMRSS
jgi:HD-GYP domain-containing protein (c-di-GMP phosphodiesterase class II)